MKWLGIGLFLGLVAYGSSNYKAAFAHTAVVQHLEDGDGVKFFSLAIGKERVTLSADSHSQMAQWLGENDGNTISVLLVARSK